MLPSLGGGGVDLEGVLIEVTGKETIIHRGQPVEAFVVEGGGATAWAAPDGRVLLQQVTLPLLGKLLLRDEEYIEGARLDAVRATPGMFREYRRRDRDERGADREERRRGRRRHTQHSPGLQPDPALQSDARGGPEVDPHAAPQANPLPARELDARPAPGRDSAPHGSAGESAHPSAPDGTLPFTPPARGSPDSPTTTPSETDA
jgi:hypothetical protein